MAEVVVSRDQFVERSADNDLSSSPVAFHSPSVAANSVGTTSSKTTVIRCKSELQITAVADTTGDHQSASQQFDDNKKRRQSIADMVHDVDFTGRVLPVVRMINGFLQTLNAIMICLGISRVEESIVFLSLPRWQLTTKEFRPILDKVTVRDQRGGSSPKTAASFYYFSVQWQYAALFAVIAYALHNIVCVLAQINDKPLNRNLCVFVAFFGVPVMALLFYTELHYSWCPWLDDYYRSTRVTADSRVGQRHHVYCNVYSWLAAAIVAAICALLLIVDGLITVNLGRGGENKFGGSQHSMDEHEDSHELDNDPVSHILESLQHY